VRRERNVVPVRGSDGKRLIVARQRNAGVSARHGGNGKAQERVARGGDISGLEKRARQRCEAAGVRRLSLVRLTSSNESRLQRLLADPLDLTWPADEPEELPGELPMH